MRRATDPSNPLYHPVAAPTPGADALYERAARVNAANLAKNAHAVEVVANAPSRIAEYKAADPATRERLILQWQREDQIAYEAQKKADDAEQKRVQRIKDAREKLAGKNKVDQLPAADSGNGN
jgi:hypothetical protein